MAGFAELRNKVAVITGASSGIGRATAHAFARAGCRLVLAARNEAALDETARECRKKGGDAVAQPCDVSRWAEVERLCSTALTHYGRLDIWVNNAAVSLFGRFDEVPLEEFDRVIRINLMGTVHGCRAAVPVFREQKYGVLINVSSVVGTIGQPEASAYVASKWGVRGLSEALRMEMIDEPGIAVCTVLPPSIDTPLFQHAANHAHRQVRPIPPVYRPEQVAALILDLARKPRREATIGSMTPLVAIGHALAPGLTERMMAANAERRHFTDHPAADSAGNLFTPQADSVHGGWAEPETGSAAKTALAVAAGAAVAVPLGVLAWRRMTDRRHRSRYI